MSKRAAFDGVIRRILRIFLVVPGLCLTLTLAPACEPHPPDRYVAKRRPVALLPIATLPPDHLLNIGDADALDMLPGVGPALAHRIIEQREAYGPYLSLDDLLNVDGIGEAKLSVIQEALSGSSAITEAEDAVVTKDVLHVLNTGDLDALDALPGIGPVLAQRIIDYREIHGDFASLDDLLDVKGIGPAKVDALREIAE